MRNKQNWIGDEGVKQLAIALKTNTTLKILNLAYNRIENHGAKYLADALKINQVMYIFVLIELNLY